MYKKALFRHLRPYIIAVLLSVPMLLFAIVTIFQCIIRRDFLLLLGMSYQLPLPLVLMDIALAVYGTINLIKSLDNLNKFKSDLGVTTAEEIDAILSVCNVQIGNKLYIDDERLINLYSFVTYPVKDIYDVSKALHKGVKGRRDYYITIMTASQNDEIHFGREEEKRESAYAQVKALLYSRNIKVVRTDNYIDKTVPVTDDPYAGYIMDEDDLKDKSDWLGSL